MIPDSLNRNFLPKVMPYIQLARLDKPWGIILLAWPTIVSLSLSSKQVVGQTWCVFLLGIILTRSLGCALNDYADMWLDKHVARTSQRPLVTGAISIREAQYFIVFLSLASASLLLWLPINVFYGAVISLLLMFLYPYMKRYIHAPQLFLGIVFSQGIPMAYLANEHVFDQVMLSLYAINILWVIIYDTIYALNDYDDDIKMSSGSLAVWLGKHVNVYIRYAYVLLAALWIIWGMLAQMHAIFYIMLLPWSYNIYMQLTYMSTKHYFKAFLLNQQAGIYITLGIMISCWI